MARVSGASHLLAQNPPQPTTPRTELAQILTGHEGLSGSVRCGQAGPRRRSESSSTIRERRDSSATEPLFLKHVAMDCQSKECIRCDGREQQRYEWRSPIRDKEEKLLLNIPLYSTQLPLPRKKLSRLYKLSQNGLQVYQVANVKAEWNLVMTFPDLSGTGKVTSVKFGADAKYVAVGSMDHNLRIFGLPRDEQMEEIKSADQ